MNIKVKRLISELINIVVFIILFYSCAFASQNLIINNFTNFNEINEKCNQILIDSGIYYLDGNKVVFIKEDYDNKITFFYEKNNYNISKYEKAKEESDLFEKNENGKYVLKEDAPENEVNNFFNNELYNASILISNQDDYKKLDKQRNDILSINSFACLLLVGLIVMFIVPLCNKKHVTIGGMIFKFELHSESNEKVGIIQLFMRFVAFFALELLPSLYLYGVNLLITLILMLATKKAKFIHDYFALTYITEQKKENGENETQN